VAIENEAFWPELVKSVQKHSLADTAERYEMSPVDLVAALRRTGTTRKPVKAKASTPAKAKAKAPKGVKRRSKRGPKSKVDAFAHLVGQVPDRVVAERAGLTVGAVRNWRVARGIPAAGRQALPPEPLAASKAAPKVAKKTRKAKRRGRRSKIDPFEQEVGTVPDRVIAAKAGVTVGAVQNFRKVRGIPGFGAGRPAAVAAPSPKAQRPAVASSPKANGLVAEAAQTMASIRRLHQRLAAQPDRDAERELLSLLSARDALVVKLGHAALEHVAQGGQLAFAG